MLRKSLEDVTHGRGLAAMLRGASGQDGDCLGLSVSRCSRVLTEMQKNLATVQRPPLILLGLLLGPTGPGPDMLVFQIAVSGRWVAASPDGHDGS